MSSFIKKFSDTEKLGADEKSKQWQREFLMDRLRSHHPQHKFNYPELSKAIRMAMLEKRYALDGVEKSNLQKCLDSMQHCIKVTTRQGLVERLESLSRQLGLKFMEDSSGLFISSDMFFLEIILDASGMLTDVKVHHECKIEQQSCSELVTCLLKGDFADFTNQLEGLSSIYQLNAEPKVKSKAFVALQAVETDMYNLFKRKSLNKDVPTLLKESPVGVVQTRRGGHPMKITYFLSSYDLLNLKTKTMLPLTMELLKSKDIGMNVSVHLEASSANKLQILPSVTFSKDNNFPIYSPLTPNNSTLLPATFVLRLNTPLPVCNSLLSKIGYTGEFSIVSESIIHLTIQVASKGLVKKCSKELFVSLPDQNHCYFFTENKNMHGSIITSVPFTEPSQVPKMLTALKQQALFYTFLASCVRTDGKLCSLENTTMLEVNAISLHKISVALQHLTEDSLVSVEFEFKDISNINVKLFSVACASNFEILNQKLTKVAEATLSIPLTIRYLLKLWENEQQQSFLNNCNTENGNFDLSGPNGDPNASNNRTGSRCVHFRDTKTKYERNIGNSDNNTNSDNLFSRPTFFNTSAVPITSSNLFSETNLLNVSSSSNLIANQFAIKTEQIKDFTSSSLQQEDFCKSPKSKIPANSASNLEISLGKKKNVQIENFTTSNSKINTSPFLPNLTIRIEKVSNYTKNPDSIKKLEQGDKKSIKYKNTVSITPVLANIVDTNILNYNNNDIQSIRQDKRLEIEIIPIVANATIPSTSLNNRSSGKHRISVKKKCTEREKNLYKKNESRRKKNNLSSLRSKLGLKIIELKDASLTLENIRMNSSKIQCNTNSTRNFLNKSLFHMSKKSKGLCVASGSGSKAYLKTMKSVPNSSISPLSQKTELDDIHEELNKSFSVLPYSEKSENQFVNNKSNAVEIINVISANNKESTKNILKIPNHSDISTVINKLEKAQNRVTVTDKFDHDKIGQLSRIHVSETTRLNEGRPNSKYMVKHTANGIKLTINKTRTAETIKREILLNNHLQTTSSLICESHTQVPRTKHTGLKPGVSSGPASKLKTAVHNNSNTGIVLTKNDNKITLYKSQSSECLPLNKYENILVSTGLPKSLSSNNLYTSSPLENIVATDKKSAKAKVKSHKISKKNYNTFRTKNVHQPRVMEGFIKTLNTNFQIPKLSTKLSNSHQIPQNVKDISNSNNITISKSMKRHSPIKKLFWG